MTNTAIDGNVVQSIDGQALEQMDAANEGRSLESQLARAQKALLDTQTLLEEYKQRDLYENHIIQQVLEQSTNRNYTKLANVRSVQLPLEQFSGDLLLTAKNPKGGMYALLGDFTGHGLSAAIGGMPVSEIFFSMAEKSMSVADMVTEMNLALNRLLPDTMFFSACVIELNARGNQLNMWSGGMHDIAYYDSVRGAVRYIKSANPPLGVANDDEFEANTNRLYCKTGDSLLVFTDGIVESRNKADIEYGDQRLYEAYRHDADDALQVLVQDMRRFVGESPQIDDISLLQILCEPCSGN